MRSWFRKFAELRNKTRGHGAITPATCARLIPAFQKTVKLILENNPIFALPWAYLHRNLSSKYRVVPVGGDQSQFSKLSSSAAIGGQNYLDGVDIWAGKPRNIELVRSDLNVNDFSVPNGDFNGKSFELLSLITDTRSRGDATPYLKSLLSVPQRNRRWYFTRCRRQCLDKSSSSTTGLCETSSLRGGS